MNIAVDFSGIAPSFAAPEIRPQRRYTVAEYVQREIETNQKHIYLNGNIVPMAGSKPPHVRIGGNVYRFLSNELDLFYGVAFREIFPLINLFDVIVDATYTGILKPDPRAYQLCLDELGLPAADCVFVDDQKKNVDGALALHIPTIHFDVTQPAQSYAAALGLLGV